MAEPSKAVLITGCSSGIGGATALAPGRARAGPSTRPPGARSRSQQLKDAGCETLALDVTDEQSMRAAVEEVERAEGAVGVLVNNAGYSQSGAIETVPLDAARRQFETNVFGLVRLTQLVLPEMRAQRWGKIVNVGSMGGRLSFPGGGPLPRDQVRAGGDLRRAALRGAGLRDRRRPARAGADHDRVRRGRGREHGCDRADRAAGEDPYAQFNATVGAVTTGAYEGPMRHLGGGPGARGEGDREGDRAPAPAHARHDHALGARS